ncbi:MAG TPA: DMT family transporter [Holophagaceae bacterium]|nr:DMT family transporter [Holophagaceae bacterium]
MSEQGGSSRGMTALVAGALLLGFAAIFTKFAAQGGARPLAIGFYRMLSALPLVALMAAFSRESWGEARHRAWALAAGVLFVGDLWLWHAALRFTSAANATLLVGLSPLWVALASIALLSARLRKRAWAGLGLAIGGALVLGLAKGARWGSGHGEALAAGASLCYAAFTLALTEARRGLGARNALLVVTATCVAGFGALGWALQEPFSGFTSGSWWALAGLGLVCQVAGWALITWGLGHLPAHAGAVGLMTQQAATVGLAWLLLGEGVKPLQGLGVALILAGVGLSVSAPPLPRRPATPA